MELQDVPMGQIFYEWTIVDSHVWLPEGKINIRNMNRLEQ